jgi:hypothetical protein
MSKSAISILKSEIKAQTPCAFQTESELKRLDRAIYNAMDDRVGHSARESLARIRDHFSGSMDEGLKNAQRAADALETGYSKTDALAAQASGLLSQARSIAAGLGEL